MAELDQCLRDLASAPVPPGLDDIDGAVFARIHDDAAADRRMPGRVAFLAAIAAAILGIASTGLPMGGMTPARAASIGGSSLAPSQLLMGDQ